MSDVPGLEWQCEQCGKIYAEYVNGYPRCWGDGEVLAKVTLVKPVELKEQLDAKR